MSELAVQSVPARPWRRVGTLLEAAPTGLMAWLRWTGLFVGLAILAVSLPLTMVQSSGGVRTGALVGVAVMAAWWVIGYRRRAFSLVADLVAAVALAAIAVALSNPAQVLCVYFVALCYRALFGRQRDMWFAGLVCAGSYATTVVAGSGMETLTLVGQSVMPAGLLLLAAPVLHEVVATLHAHERAAASSQILADAGVALLSSGSPRSIAVTASSAARRLLAASEGYEVAFAVVEDGQLVHIDGHGTAGSPLPLQALPDAVRASLSRGVPFATLRFSPATVGMLSVRSTGSESLVMPLVSQDLLRGAFVLSRSGGSVDAEAAAATLQPLAAFVMLALDSAGLTDELLGSETRFRSLVQNCSDVIAVVDRGGSVRYLSPTVTRVLGYAPSSLQRASLETLLHPSDLERWRDFFAEVLQGREPVSLNCRLRHHASGWRHTEIVAANLLDEPSVAGVVLNVRDVSQRKVLEEELVHRASHDSLTGLPNRTHFLDRLRTALSNSARQDSLAVLFIDLDDFKTVNDTFGHAAGDSVLLDVTTRLTSCLRPGDLASRLSGDEFAVLLEGIEPGGEAARVSERLLAAIAEPFLVVRESMRLHASIGVAVGGMGVEDAEDLLHRADLAMYSAKGNGKNRVEVFHPDAHASLNSRRQLRADLQWAVLRGELEVRYQPIVSLVDRRIVSAEALVRWRHPVRGLLGPATFIALAEESDLIADVFDVVLRDACAMAQQWRRNTTDQPVSVSVNLSAVQLHQSELVDHVIRVLADTGLPPQLLTLEVTESVLVGDPQQAAETLATLKQLGVRTAIDDFGTGYSSLAYLRRLPIDVLKIDKIFVQGVGTSDGAALARTIIDLGNQLGMQTVAEGIELPAQRDALLMLGCNLGQGHLFSRAVSGSRMAAMVAGRRLGVT
jgi:diguanylate cyclase (GGDEF)-like protein/PAS domain S-box-containing protein